MTSYQLDITLRIGHIFRHWPFHQEPDIPIEIGRPSEISHPIKMIQKGHAPANASQEANCHKVDSDSTNMYSSSVERETMHITIKCI